MKRFICLSITLLSFIFLCACSNDGMINRQIKSVKVQSQYQGGWIEYTDVEKVIKKDDSIVEIYLENGDVITTSIDNVVIYSHKE